MKTASHATQQRQPVFSLMNTLLDSLALANKVSARYLLGITSTNLRHIRSSTAQRHESP
jgi:hypothetical protein